MKNVQTTATMTTTTRTKNEQFGYKAKTAKYIFLKHRNFENDYTKKLEFILESREKEWTMSFSNSSCSIFFPLDILVSH